MSWLTREEHDRLTRLFDALVPDDGISPGAGAAGGADYVDRLLGAFTADPPRIWPRDTARSGDGDWLELGAAEQLAWRIRIEGSLGLPAREFNGAVRGWQQTYRDGLTDLGDLADRSGAEVRALLEADDRLADLAEVAFAHACESLYGDPVYGGNRDEVGWSAIGFDGDVIPTGWSEDEVTLPVRIQQADGKP